MAYLISQNTFPQQPNYKLHFEITNRRQAFKTELHAQWRAYIVMLNVQKIDNAMKPQMTGM